MHFLFFNFKLPILNILLQIRIRGEAEAFAISAKAKAEAEQMAKKAEAWREYREAAMVDMLLDTLPKVHAILNHLPNIILHLKRILFH